MFNAEHFITETLESALSQTWFDKEIVVVDDGSKDRSLDYAKHFEPRGVKVISTENRGASHARNVAFENSTGNYIQYLDADDLLSPEKIEIQMNCLMQYPNAIASSTWGRFFISWEQASFSPEKVWEDYDQPLNWLLDAWESGGMMQTSCWLTPRELIEKSGGWDEEITMNDDGEFFARVLLLSSRVIFCREAMVYYRSGLNDSLSQLVNQGAIESLYKSYLSYERNVLAIEDSERVRHALMKNYLSFIYEYYPKHSEFTDLCRERIKTLGFDKLEPFGGKKALWLSRLIGFNNMLKLRALINL